MNHWLLIFVVLPISFISWGNPKDQQAFTATESSLSFSGDTLKLNTLIFSDFISPNGDGYNDHFVIVNVSDYPGNSIKIFNRWGDLVFMTDNYLNEWDGTTNQSGAISDNKLTDGVYFFEFYDGIGNNVTGKITLKR